jgi:hypothetical protein
MTEGQAPPGTPEAWEIDDLSRMRRVHEYLDREYLRIPESPYQRQDGGCVPSTGERSSNASGGTWELLFDWSFGGGAGLRSSLLSSGPAARASPGRVRRTPAAAPR